jgi:hypothetical protein
MCGLAALFNKLLGIIMRSSARSTHTSSYEIKDIDAGLLRQRRNLLFISISIIIYFLGNAQIVNIPSFFGSVKLENQNIIYYGIWIFLFYSIWRYWLYSEPAKDQFGRELNGTFSVSRLHKRFVSHQAKNHNADNGNLNPVINYGFFKREMDFSKSVYANKKAGTLKREHLEEEYREGMTIKISFCKYFPIELYCQLKTMFTGRSFSDYFLPYIMALIAIFLGAFHW